MTFDEMVTQVATEYNYPKIFVTRTYRAFWRAVKEYISSLPLKDDLTDEEFKKLRPNVNIPSLGKFYVTLEDYKKRKRIFKNKQERYAAYKENKATVH